MGSKLRETRPDPGTFGIRTPALFSKRNVLSRATSGTQLKSDWVGRQEGWKSRMEVVVGEAIKGLG